eukprot:gene5225-8837_t
MDSQHDINTEDAVFEVDLGEQSVTQGETESTNENDVQIQDEVASKKQSEKEPKRAGWGNRFSFILSAVGASIGFGNFLRFPYLAFKMGGGAFLIPFFISILIIGDKILLLELSMGQLVQKTAVKAFQTINKRAGGLGTASVLFGSFIVSTYYVVIVGWACVYFVYSFFVPLPWFDGTVKGAENFFYNVVLQRSAHLWDFQGISWRVLIGLAITWVIIFISIWRGVSSIQFVSYITVPLPFVVFVILFIRSLFLPGSWDGIYYYLYPDFSKLWTMEIWLAAIGQVFFSLSIGSGCLIGYASFSKKDQNVTMDAYMISFFDLLFSVVSGFIVFQILGYMAEVQQVPIAEVTKSGFGLAFIAFPQAVATMPLANIFSILIFLTLISLGLSSAIALVECGSAVVHDAFPKVPKVVVAAATCIVGFILGVPYTLSNGYYFLDLVDYFISSYCLVGAGLLECIVFGYLIAEISLIEKLKNVTSTGFRKVLDFAKIILGHSAEDWRHKVEKETSPLQPFWKHVFTIHLDWTISIKYISPIALSLILAYNVVDEFVHPYGFEEHGYSAIVFAFIPIIFASIVIGMAIIPCGTFSWQDVREKISGIKSVKETLEHKFEPKPVPEGISSEELQNMSHRSMRQSKMPPVNTDLPLKSSVEEFDEARNELEGIGDEFHKRAKTPRFNEEEKEQQITEPIEESENSQKLQEVQIE